MTYFHFINCAALTFLPFFVIYKATKLSEYGAVRVVLYGFFGYLLTQLTRLIVMATLIPSEDLGWNFVQEGVKTVIGLIEVVGAYFTLAQARDKNTKILGVSLGWSLGDAVARRLAPLWLGATGYDWDPIYLLLASEANIHLIYCIAFFTLVWMYSRHQIDTPILLHIKLTLLLMLFISPFITFLHFKVGLDEFGAAAVRTVLTLILAFITYHLYKQDESNLEKKKSSSS